MQFLDQKKIKEEYEHRRCLWGLEPNRYVKQIPELINKGRVLDIGVGEGRNALYLAERGFEVVGIDILDVAVEKFLKIAKEKRLDVEGEVIDARGYEPEGEYDVIICTATMHYFKEGEARDIIEKMKRHTKKGGINLITTFTKEDIGFKEYPDFYFVGCEDDLRGLYEGWEIIKCENYIKHDTHDKPHDHHIAVLIARK